MDNIREIVRLNFIRLVSESGLKKREIAHQMGVSEASMQRWKTGDAYPEMSNVELLAEVLKVSPVEFYKPLGEHKKPQGRFMRSLTSIPEQVYELAAEVGPDSPAWAVVIDRLRHEAGLASPRKKKAKPA